MTATLASTARTSATTGAGTRRQRGAAPKARPEFGGPTAVPLARDTRRSAGAAACRVTPPAARRASLVLKVKVGVVGALALIGLGVSTVEFSTWTHADPAVEFVAGDPAWAHVTGR